MWRLMGSAGLRSEPAAALWHMFPAIMNGTPVCFLKRPLKPNL